MQAVIRADKGFLAKIMSLSLIPFAVLETDRKYFPFV